MSTWVWGQRWRIRRVAVTPSIPGIIISISTTSGDSCSHRRTASSPSAASPTRTRSSKVVKNAAKPLRQQHNHRPAGSELRLRYSSFLLSPFPLPCELMSGEQETDKSITRLQHWRKYSSRFVHILASQVSAIGAALRRGLRLKEAASEAIRN